MKRRAVIVAASVLLLILLAGCGADRQIIREDAFAVIRSGRETTITDAQNGVVCILRDVRVRKARTEEEATERRRMRVIADTDTLLVMCAGRMIAVTVKETGELYCFRV